MILAILFLMETLFNKKFFVNVRFNLPVPGTLQFAVEGLVVVVVAKTARTAEQKAVRLVKRRYPSATTVRSEGAL